jgi:O-antigen ligase
MPQRILELSLLGLAFILPVSIAGTNIALALATGALLAHRACGGRLAWREAWTPVVWLLCLYCALAVLTSFTGVLPSRSLQHLNKDLHKLWVVVILLLALRTAPTRQLPAAMAAGFVFTAAFGIMRSGLGSYYGVVTSGNIAAWMRVRAFVDPVTFGEMMALGLLGGLAFLARRDSPDRRPAIAFTVLLTVALLLNQTRGAIFGVLAGLIMMAAAQPALQRWLKWGLAAAILAVYFASFRRYGPTPGTDWQFTRLALWDAAWSIFKDHLWLGVGPSNYATVFTDYHHGLIEGRAIWGSAHNIFLQHLAERGLAGLAVLLSLFGTFLAQAWRRARTSSEPESLLGLAAVTAFLVMNMTESAFQNEQITTLFLAIWSYTTSQTGART